MLGLMREDPSSIDELWNIAQKRPRSEEAIEHRRDWFEYDYARDQLKLAGIDPFGTRPKLVSNKAAGSKSKKNEKKAVKKVAKKPLTKRKS